MPWTYESPPDVAENWNENEIRACVDAANAVLNEGGTDEEAIFACINAAGKERSPMAQKTYHATLELKEDGEEGTFKSVFAKFNVIDHDGDVTLPGAFEEGAKAVVEGWNHDYGLPPGKGTIHANQEEAWIEGRFFLDTRSGKDHYRTLKGLEGLEEWSYTFDIEKSENGDFDGERVRFLKGLDVWGVAPVTRGAGIDTRTVALKSDRTFTDAEIKRLEELWQELWKGKESAGDGGSDSSDDGEGEAGDAGKPSGVSPSVILTQIDIIDLEE